MPTERGAATAFRRFAKAGVVSWLAAGCATFVVFYGVWTIISNIEIVASRTFRELSWLALAAPILSVFVLVYVFRSANDKPLESAAPLANTDSDPEDRHAIVYVLVGACLAALYAFAGLYVVFWVLAILCLGQAYWRGRRSPAPQFVMASNSRWNTVTFVVALIAALLATLFINRPNPDQTLSIHMAASVLDHPTTPMYLVDTMHGIPGAYLLPTYRVESFEPLAALTTQAFGLGEPVWAFHLVLAPIFTIFSVCAAALLLSRLLPRWWGWGALALVSVLLLLRGTYTSYGNFAFLRMFEGKSPFVTALVPLIAVFAMDFVDRPSPGTWILLALAQVSAVGLTANALYAAPMAAGLALVASWRPSWRATRRIGVGLLASIYPVTLAVILRATIIHDGLKLEDFQQLIPIDMAARLVLGNGFTLWLWLLALLSGWSVLRDRSLRHWTLAVCLGFMLLNMNPYLDKYWGQYVTAKYLTWRLLWPVPLPIFLAAFVVQGVRGIASPHLARKGLAVVVALACAATLAIAKPWVDPIVSGQLRLGRKVPHAEYDVAAQLNRLAGSEVPVLAPENVAEWIPTFRHNAYAVVARLHYTEGLMVLFAGRVDEENLRQRLILGQYVDGTSPDNLQAELTLQHWLAQQQVGVVAVPEDFARMSQIAQILEKAGLVRSKYMGYIIYSH